MPFKHGSKARVMVNAYPMSDYLREFQGAFTVDSADTSVFGSKIKTGTPGLVSATYTGSGLFNGDEDAVDQVFNGILNGGADNDIIVWSPQGDVLGSRAEGFSSLLTGYTVTASISEVSAVQFQGQNNTGSEAGIIIHPLAVEGSGGNGTTVDLVTTSTSNGWAAYLNAISGTSLVVKVQDSATGSSWADLTGSTFTTVNARSAQRIEGSSTATVRRFVRAFWTGSGTFQLIFCRRA